MKKILICIIAAFLTLSANAQTVATKGCVPDEEDITLEGNVLKFKDRIPSNGMGYKILRSKKSFSSQVNTQNTIYEVRYNFDLAGSTVTLPRGAVIRMNGGSIDNGQLILQSDTRIIGNGEKCNKLRIIIDNRDVANVSISGIELVGYKNPAKKTGDLAVGIDVRTGASVSNIFISSCTIHGYNAGISIRGNNVYIKDNLLYDNGDKRTVQGVHDAEVDICAGNNANSIESCNFEVIGNRCLSCFVHRNIDCGEMLSEDNIIISNNICVSMDGLAREIVKGAYKSQCILVGYAGNSSRNKAAIISGNICKHCDWAGIYVRANNTPQTAGSNGYVTIISGNYIEDVIKGQSSSFGAGIACELREGSIISNNIIKSSTQGINIGMVNSNSHVKVFGNSIDDCTVGITNDSVSKKIDITENSITNTKGIGIAITEATAVAGDSAEKFVNISGNTITLSASNTLAQKGYSDDNPSGIFLYNVGSRSILISSNYIHGNNINTNVGITFNANPQHSHITLSYNQICGCYIGVCKKADSIGRNTDCRLMSNSFYNCYQALSIGANSKKQLFIVENGLYVDCKSKFGDQSWARMVFDGKINPDGSFVVFDDSQADCSNSRFGTIKNAPVCFCEKEFRKGDVVVPSSATLFSKAECVIPDGKNSQASWRVDNASIPDSLLPFCAVQGQMVYSTSSKSFKSYDAGWRQVGK